MVTDSLYVPGPTTMMSPDAAAATANGIEGYVELRGEDCRAWNDLGGGWDKHDG